MDEITEEDLQMLMTDENCPSDNEENILDNRDNEMENNVNRSENDQVDNNENNPFST
jgi:hypothetical protein